MSQTGGERQANGGGNRCNVRGANSRQIPNFDLDDDSDEQSNANKNPMRGRPGHTHSQSQSQVVNQRAQLANAYQELGKELASEKIKVVGNYTLGKVIGEGAYGKVRIGTHRLSSTRVAVKQIPKAMSASLTREIHHHRRLHHPNVTQLYEVIATETSIWLITELCSGGELYDYLVEKGRLSELETRQIFGELCLALHYVHSQGVVHRDLKLENVLLDERCHVKLSDFGFTREFEQGRFLETYCGTTGYAAPEMLLCQRYTGTEVDCWSLGVILYCLLVGTLPFDDDDEDVMRSKIIQSEYEDPEWLSTDVRDLIRNLLQKDPMKRLSVSQTLAHPWFSRPILEEPDSLPLNPSEPHIIDLTDDVSDHPPPPPPKEDIPLNKVEPIAIPESSSTSTSGRPTRTQREEREELPLASSVASEATFHSATSALSQSSEGNDLPPTPADSAGDHDFARTANSVEEETSDPSGREESEERRTGETGVSIHRMESQSTIRKQASDHKISPVDSSHSHAQTIIATVLEEEDQPTEMSRSSTQEQERFVRSRGSSSSLPPSSFPTRTPVRTKRRSVSSNLTNSPPGSPTVSPPPIAPLGNTKLPDFSAEIHVKAPLAFSTDLERNLLSTLSLMGFDTGQIVHSVLTDACDAASALWWMLKKKAERHQLLEARKEAERQKAAAALEDRSGANAADRKGSRKEREKEKENTRENDKDDKDELVLDKSRGRKEKDNEPKEKELPGPGDSRRPSGFRTKPTPALPDGAPSTSTSRPPVPLMLGQGPLGSSPSGLALGGLPTAPDLTFVPPTPVNLSHDTSTPTGRKTPPLTTSGSFPFSLSLHLQSPTPSSGSGTPISPDRTSKGANGNTKREGKQRASSVSMLQRATTALSAAGLTRKKSAEGVKDDEKERERSSTAGSSTGSLLRAVSGTASTVGSSATATEERPTSSGSHVSHKLTKSPPTPRTDKENNTQGPNTTPAGGRSLSEIRTMVTANVHSDITPDSPWAVTDAPPTPWRASAPIPPYSRLHSAPTPANSPGNSLSQKVAANGTIKIRNRASLLAVFRTWFNEDKRKRKSASPQTLPTIPAGVAAGSYYPPGRYVSSPRAASIRGRGKNPVAPNVNTPRAKRPSVSSRRSSSLGSRRSSVNSINNPITGLGLSTSTPNNATMLSRQRSDASRRSLGTRTPTSERGDMSSRPSSVRSFSMTPMNSGNRRKRHSKGSSTSSNDGTQTPSRVPTAQYHRRAGSGSSSTRVIRQQVPVQKRPHHVRSDSQASSVHSRASSRPGSYHENMSDVENSLSLFGPIPRSGSPMLSSRRSGDFTTLMVAHRNKSVFGAPSAGLYAGGRSSWKKSWGHEPPAWSSRSMQIPPELPADPSGPSIRDVFSNGARASKDGADDDDEWTDEDDDEPLEGYLGGLGQRKVSLSASGDKATKHLSAPALMIGTTSATMVSSGPLPGSPSIKKMEIPPLVGPRNRAANQRAVGAGRTTGPATYKPSELSRLHGRTSPTANSTLSEVQEEQHGGGQSDGSSSYSDSGSGPQQRSRRQLPGVRSGPAFKQAIQEEDEDEEEE